MIPLGPAVLESSGISGSCADFPYFFGAEGYGEFWGAFVVVGVVSLYFLLANFESDIRIVVSTYRA